MLRSTLIAFTAVFILVISASAQRVWPGQLPSGQQQAPPASQVATPIAQPPTVSAQAAARKLAGDVEVTGDGQWTDTAIDVMPGDRIIATSDGTIHYLANASGPNGLPRTWREVISALPVNDAGIGALIGRVGNADASMPFLIGTQKEIVVTRPGRLFLGVNELQNELGNGAYKVKLKIVPGAAQPAAPSGATVDLSQKALDQLPRRVSDKDGNAGDMINFLIIGSEPQMKSAFASAGWVLVDRTPVEGALHALFSTYQKKTYTEMPMSELYLFNRPQDFGFAHAEPVQVVQTRHHLRIWKAAFEIDGQPVWVGAATHDIGIEHDQRRQGITAVTHKIDPNVDQEREFVASTLGATGIVAGSTYVQPSNPIQDARTATGGSFHSDGRVLILKLVKSATPPASATAQQ